MHFDIMSFYIGFLSGDLVVFTIAAFLIWITKKIGR